MNRLSEVSETASDRQARRYGLRDAISYVYYQVFGSLLPGALGTFIFKQKCRVFGVSVGKNVKCFGPVHVIRAPGSHIIVGDNVGFISRSYRSTASSIYSPCKLRTHFKAARIEIGNNVGLNGASITARSKTITIGAGTMLAPNVTMVDSDYHPTWPPEERHECLGPEHDKSVAIGENVWIGLNSTILKGVTIGNNSVIGAGSIVVNDIPANSLAAGNPAKVLKSYIGESK